jgi:hypothetical protein
MIAMPARPFQLKEKRINDEKFSLSIRLKNKTCGDFLSTLCFLLLCPPSHPEMIFGEQFSKKA